MGRAKSTPIDASRLRSINGANKNPSENFVFLDLEDGRAVMCTEEPSFVTFSIGGAINDIHKVHKKAESIDCIDFRSTWVSQALLQEEEKWIASQEADGVLGDKQAMKSTVRDNRVRARQNERFQKYLGPSDEMNPRPERVTRTMQGRPKQLELSPVDDAINRLAVKMKGRELGGRMPLFEYWGDDSHDNTKSRGRSEGPTTEEATDVVMDDVTVGETSSPEENDFYRPPSRRQRAPAPPPRAASAMMTASVRACINCYEKHHGCDRGLPACSTCVASNANCVYPEVSLPS